MSNAQPHPARKASADRKTVIHQSRLTSVARQKAGKLSDYQDIYRRLVMVDLAKDMEMGFFLSYYRNFAIPSLARTLRQSGEITAMPNKRSYDTAIVIYEIIAGGFQSPRSQEMVALLRRVHRGVPGSNSDFLYVLMTLLVLPIRWTEQHGWRKPLDIEKEAAATFFHELGTQMGLKDVPASYPQGAALLDAYEAENAAASAEGQELMAATVKVFRDRLPRPVRPLARDILTVFFNDERISSALGLKSRVSALAIPLNAALGARNAWARRRPLREYSRFVPGKSASSMYPGGYDLGELGPAKPDPRAT